MEPQSNRTGRRPGVTVSTEALQKALADLASLPTIEVRTASVLFRVGVHAAYAAAREGRFGAMRFGNQFRFPSARIREALGMPQPTLTVAADAAPSTEEGSH
jgi:hypothetical protein